MKFKNFIALVLMLSIVVSTNGFSTLSAQKISDENYFYSSILSPKKQVKVGDYYELLNKKQNLLMNTQNEIEETVEAKLCEPEEETVGANEETVEVNETSGVEANENPGVGANETSGVGANACGARPEEEENSTESKLGEPEEENVESKLGEPATASEATIEDEQIATVSEIDEQLKLGKKEESMTYGADPHKHKVCGVDASVDCTHTLDGITHTENVEYELISHTSNMSDFIDFVNSKSTNYYFLNSHLTFSEIAYQTMSKDVYICLNGYNFYTKCLFSRSDYRIYITNCKTNSNICLNTDSTPYFSRNVYIYGVNKNITCTNENFNNSSSHFLYITSESSIYYYNVIVNIFMNDITDRDRAFIEYSSRYQGAELNLEDLDIKLTSKNNYKYSLIQSVAYLERGDLDENKIFKVKMKNNRFDLSNANVNQYFVAIDSSDTEWTEKKALDCNRISFYGENIFDGYELKSEDGSTRDFIKCFDINIVDGETTIKNFKNYTSGKIFHCCNLNVKKDAVLNINSNQIKYEQDKNQSFIDIINLSVEGSMIASNNSFVSANDVDSSIRTFLYHTPNYSSQYFYIGSKKIVIENTKIYKSDDNTEEVLNDGLYIYDFYLNSSFGFNNSYPYIVYKQDTDVYNKDNNFGKLGFSSDTTDAKSFVIYFISKWNSTYVDIENIDDFDKHFVFGKKNNDVYIHKINDKLYISLHGSHKICGAKEGANCIHTLGNEHADIKNYELLDIKLDAAGLKSKIERGNDIKYLCLRNDILSEDVVDITLKNDVHICLNGHTIKNVVFKTYLTAMNPEIKWERFNLYIDECRQSNNTIGSIYCKDDFFVRDVKLHICCHTNSYNNTDFIPMYIKSLCKLESTTKINGTTVRGLLTDPIDCNIYGAWFYKYDDNTEVSNCWFLNTDRYNSGEYQIVNLNIEKVRFHQLNLNSFYSRNIYLKNKYVEYGSNKLTKDFFNITGSGEIRFLGNDRDNTIRYSKTNHYCLFESKVPFIIESGKLLFDDNEVYADNAKSITSFNSGLQINNGAVLEIKSNPLRKNKYNQYIVKLSGESENIVNGELNISNNGYVYSTEDDDFIHSTLFMEDKAQLKIGGKINVSGTKAYKEHRIASYYLSTQHICQIYSEMENYHTPIFELAEGTTLNTDCKFDGIHFKNNGGSGHIINNFNYDESTHQNIFVLDKHDNDNLGLYQDGNNLTVRGKLYTVRYNYNNPGGTTFNQVSTSSVPTKMITNNTTKPDHIFIGWATVSDLIPKSPNDYVDYKENSIEFVREFDVDGQVVDLYGVWFNLNTKYNVGFDMHGHGAKIATISVGFDSLIDEEPKPTEKGYIFEGWYKEATYQNLWDFKNEKVNDDMILHAKWKAITYTITFNAKTLDGKGVDVDPATITKEYDKNVTLSSPSWVGHTFHGWFTDNTSFNNKYNGTTDIADTQNANVTIFAKWTINKYVVTFEMNGHGEQVADLQNVEYDNTITEPTKPEETGWVFGGWYREDTLSNKWNFVDAKVRDNTILYAKWDPKQYNFTLVLDEGASYVSNYTAPTNRKFNEETQLPTDANVYKKGYKVKSWHENQNFSDTGFTKIAENTDTVDNKIYYLQMEPIGYKVTFKKQDDSIIGNNNTIECKYDNSSSYKALNTDHFTKTNYTNQYYRYKETRNINDNSLNNTAKPNRERFYSEYEFNNLTDIDGVEFIYEPIFTMISNEDTEPGKNPEEHEASTKDNETFIITYYRNIDNNDTENQSVTYDYNKEAKIESASSLGLIYDGHKCKGWAVEADKTIKKYNIDEEVFFEADASPESSNNINLYALWEENGYKVTFTADGLNGVSGDKVSYDLSFAENKMSPVKSHFTKANENVAYYEYAGAILNGSSYDYTPARERLYTNKEFSRLAIIEGIELIYKPHFTKESNSTTDPDKSTDERDEQTKEYETFKITYYANKFASDTEKQIIEYRYDEESLIKGQIFSNDGYTFLGWSDNASSKNIKYSENEEIFFKVEDEDSGKNDISLYAVWEENGYIVVYTKDGDADIIGDDFRSKTYKYSELGTALDDSHFKKANHRFAYYEFLKIDNATGTYNLLRERLYAKQNFTKLVDVDSAILYFRPVFTMISNEETDPGSGKNDEEHKESTKENETFVITYHSNDENNKNKIVVYRYDKQSFAEAEIFKREGYIFIGWSEDDAATTATYESGQEILLKVENDDHNNLDLYAVWIKITYTVVFSANGGKDIVGSDVRLENIFYLDEVNAPASDSFTRNSDTFAYYEFVSATLNGNIVNTKPLRERFYAEQKISKLTKTSGIEFLYRAVFTNDGNATDEDDRFNKLNFEIHYYANNNTNTKVVQISSYSSATFIQNNNFKYEGYIFKGYSLSKNDKNIKYKNGDEVFVKIEDSRILNLYAVWNTDPNFDYQPSYGGGGSSGGGGGGGGSFSMDPIIGVQGQQYAKYYVQNEDIYVLSSNKSTGGDGNNGNKMNGKWYYEVEIAKWKYITDPTDRFFNPQIKEVNGFLVDGMYMLGNNKYVYSFDQTGYLETGFISKNGKIYYAETNGNFIGALLKGENEINGMIYTFNDYTAEMVPPKDNIYIVTNGEAKLNPLTNNYHYFVQHDNGQLVMLTNGMYKIKAEDGKYYNYYFDIFGNIITGLVSYNGKMYYMGPDGREDETMVGALNIA